MFTADNPQPDDKTELVIRVIGISSRIICADTPKRSSLLLHFVEFALSNVVHASTATHHSTWTVSHTLAFRKRYHYVVQGFWWVKGCLSAR